MAAITGANPEKRMAYPESNLEPMGDGFIEALVLKLYFQASAIAVW